jgi:hypothetical protein
MVNYKVKFHDPMKKNQPETFKALYKPVKVADEQNKVAKMDRHVMQRLIATYEASIRSEYCSET